MSTENADIVGEDPILMVDDSVDPEDLEDNDYDDDVEGADLEGTGVISVGGSENDVWRLEP